MARPWRRLQPGHCYHVLNRGNARARLFLDRLDHVAFVKLLADLKARYGIGLLAYCLMPNHFHLVLQHGEIDSGSRAMHWSQTKYAARFRAKYKGSGHIYQGRFKSFPIQSDEHLLTVMRYVERNPVRANLIKRAAAWRWSSAAWRGRPESWLDESPVPLGKGWSGYVDTPQTSTELDSLRRSVCRGTPFGSPTWQAAAAESHGLLATLRPRGRPRIINDATP